MSPEKFTAPLDVLTWAYVTPKPSQLAVLYPPGEEEVDGPASGTEGFGTPCAYTPFGLGAGWRRGGHSSDTTSEPVSPPG